MARLFVFGVFLLVCLSCKDQKAEVVANENFINEMSSEKWPKKVAVNAKAALILEEWEEYKALENSFDALYLVDNREDLSLTIENLIEAQKNLEGSEYPPELDIPQVKSRQKVFKTYILKVKGDLIYRLDPHDSILQMIEAYNAFRNQFNVIVNNTLDTKLILEE